MSNNHHKNSSINTFNSCLQETEDGEIEDVNTNLGETISHDKEIENYYNILKNIGTSLRCCCCSEVYSDPVRLQCGHLIDRYCVSNKIKSNVMKCPVCERESYCVEIDDLITDFDVAAQIPPKPNSLIEMINKHGNNNASLGKRIKLEAGVNEPDKNEVSDDGEYEIVNGIKVKREKNQRRRKKTRWSAIEENKFDTKHASVVVDPQVAFTGVISDILAASNNQPKNITISQFKKYTEISNKADIMNLLTEVVMQNTKIDTQNAERKSNPLSDKDILELIPSQELEDMFELEKIQLVMLYREALDKGVLIFPSQNKNTSPSNKQPLLPTPKRSKNGSVESHENTSPVSSSRKRYTSESSKSSNLSYRSSNKSLLDSSDSESAGDTFSRSHKKDKRQKSGTKQSSMSVVSEQQQQQQQQHSISTKTTSDNLSSANESSSQIPVTTTTLNNNNNTISPVTNENGHHNKPISCAKPTTDDCQKPCDNIRYRDDINRLHALYSIMYHASLKMKEFEHKMESEDYQNSYNTYCENYTEYQQLYSNLQSVINIDTINPDKPDSNNSYTGSDTATPLVNGGITVSVAPVSNQEQASSTISPACYAPDSTDFFNGPQITKRQQTNSELKANIQNNLSNYQQFKKENNSVDSKKKIGYLWISNLSKEVRTGDLCRLFGKYGHISKVKLFQYKAQIPPTYFGLVFMPNYNEAENAIRQLQNKIMNDKQIHIKMLCPNSDSMNKTN